MTEPVAPALSAPPPFQKGKGYHDGKGKSKMGSKGKGRGKGKSSFSSKGKGKGKSKGKAKGNKGKQSPKGKTVTQGLTSGLQHFMYKRIRKPQRRPFDVTSVTLSGIINPIVANGLHCHNRSSTNNGTPTKLNTN